MQFRQALKLFLDKPDPFALKRLLLGTRRGIDLRQVRPVPVVPPGYPKALVLPPGVDPQVPGNAKHPRAHVVHL